MTLPRHLFVHSASLNDDVDHDDNDGDVDHDDDEEDEDGQYLLNKLSVPLHPP